MRDEDLVLVHTLERIPVDGGDVLHYMRNDSDGYLGFGEVYFSMIEPRAVKAWKRHTKTTMNLVVPFGGVRFVFLNGSGEPQIVTVGDHNYRRITVPPMIWFGFQGVGDSQSMVANLSNLPHDPDEVERVTIDTFTFEWGTDQ